MQRDRNRMECVEISVTKLCNLRCRACPVPVLPDNERTGLSLTQFRGICDALAAMHCRTIRITGGEPFARRDLIEHLCRRRFSEDTSVMIATNGSLIDDRMAAILAAAPSETTLMVSIDGMGALHDALRGRAGLFDRITRSLELLEKHGVAYFVSTVVQRRNQHDVAALIAHLRARFRPLYFTLIPVDKDFFGRKDFAAAEAFTFAEAARFVEANAGLFSREFDRSFDVEEIERRQLGWIRHSSDCFLLTYEEVAAEIKRITARGCAVPGRMMVVCPSAVAEHQDTFQVSACWHNGAKHDVKDLGEYLARHHHEEIRCQGCISPCYLFDEGYRRKVLGFLGERFPGWGASPARAGTV